MQNMKPITVLSLFDGVSGAQQALKNLGIECERLQGFPDSFTNSVSKTQRLKALGNSFTVPVIEHILKAILYETK